MSKITPEESLNLKRLLKDSQAEDNTEYIRRVKHSEKIRDDIRKLDKLKKEESALYAENRDQFKEKAQGICNFLFVNYTDIFNKVVADELDLAIMSRLLVVLKLIEENKVDQHEGSVLVGKILKELYVDSALKRCDNLDKANNKMEVMDTQENKSTSEVKPISWNEWKNKK
jgi:hypothetical protein